ncbi:MAG: hypothetical protein U5N86_07370 [Planctomycetota bacterium]|nr:hypothetical protein [Planctomycetota bacterium]
MRIASSHWKKRVESDGLLNVKGSTFTDCQTALRSKQTWAEDCVFASCVFGIAVGQGKSLITRNCTFRNCTEDAIDALIPSSINNSGYFLAYWIEPMKL